MRRPTLTRCDITGCRNLALRGTLCRRHRLTQTLTRTVRFK